MKHSRPQVLFRWTFNPAVLTRACSSGVASRGSGDVSSSREEPKFEVMTILILKDSIYESSSR